MMQKFLILASAFFWTVACDAKNKQNPHRPSAEQCAEYAPTAKRFDGWKGNVTGDFCKTDADCGSCNQPQEGLPSPGGLMCMCLPELNKCGFGHPMWITCKKPL